MVSSLVLTVATDLQITNMRKNRLRVYLIEKHVLKCVHVLIVNYQPGANKYLT